MEVGVHTASPAEFSILNFKFLIKKITSHHNLKFTQFIYCKWGFQPQIGTCVALITVFIGRCPILKKENEGKI